MARKSLIAKVILSVCAQMPFLHCTALPLNASACCCPHIRYSRLFSRLLRFRPPAALGGGLLVPQHSQLRTAVQHFLDVRDVVPCVHLVLLLLLLDRPHVARFRLCFRPARVSQGHFNVFFVRDRLLLELPHLFWVGRRLHRGRGSVGSREGCRRISALQQQLLLAATAGGC